MTQQSRAVAQAPLAGLRILTILLLSITTASAWTKRANTHGKTVIAYYASWQWYDREKIAAPSNLDHSKVDRYNFAFFQTNARGDIWGTDSWADPITLYGDVNWNHVAGQPTHCSWTAPGQAPSCQGHQYQNGLIYQAHAAGTEVYPSIGGWTLSDHFPALAANAVARKAFADNCVKLIETYDFDGIDIDWEYPGYADHNGTPEDTENFSLLMKDVRDALDELGLRDGKFYGLTAALPCGPVLINNIQIDVVKDYLTELNLMTYDFHGAWAAETGANAPLYDMDGSPNEDFSVHSCVENWVEGGGTRDQINIGLPFYGRSFAGSGLTKFGDISAGKVDMVSWPDDEGSPQYYNIVDKMSQFTTVRDEQTKTQYMYNSQGFVTYDDERAICDKTEYAMDQELNGYIIWEISGDLMPDGSTPLLDACINRLNTDERCDPDEAIKVVAEPAVKESNPWYPSQSLGFCVNDGKEAEKYIQSDELFVSVVACCGNMFKHNFSHCTASSFDPGSIGLWVAGSTTEESPWYPHIELGYCVNDGNEDQYFTPDKYKFMSAEGCCDEAYSFETDCLEWSMNPDTDGIWIDGVDEGEPWYPQVEVGHCVADGNHEENNIGDANLFDSPTACCDAIYSYNADCLEDSTSMPVDDNTLSWYPDSNGCTSESPIPVWIATTFGTMEECCIEYYSESYITCISDIVAQVMEPVVTNETGLMALPSASTMIKIDPEEALNAHQVTMDQYLFYPSFGDGSSVACVTGGEIPEWVSQEMLYDSHQECCESFPSPWSEQCLNHPYYPNFENNSCHNDGAQPDWMAGRDFFSDDQWKCCQDFFGQDSDKLGECAKIYNIDESDYLASFYEVLDSRGRAHW